MRLLERVVVWVFVVTFTGSAMGAGTPGPADGFTIHVLAPHQMESGDLGGPFHHYCKPVKEGAIFQCLLFASADPAAALVGVEYFVESSFSRP